MLLKKEEESRISDVYRYFFAHIVVVYNKQVLPPTYLLNNKIMTHVRWDSLKLLILHWIKKFEIVTSIIFNSHIQKETIQTKLNW